MSLIYYIILGVTAISYLLGLFLSYCEKKNRMTILAELGDAGFINVFGNDYLEHMEIETPMMYQEGFSDNSSYMDEEII